MTPKRALLMYTNKYYITPAYFRDTCHSQGTLHQNLKRTNME